MSGSLVQALLRGLLGLHLETTTDGIEGVGGGGRTQHGGLGGGKRRDHSHNSEVVLVGVQADNGIEGSELHTTISDDTHNRDTETVIQSKDTSLLHGLLDAIAETVEITLSGSDIRCQTGTGIIQGVDNGQGRGTSGTTGREIRAKKLPEIGLGVVP